MGRGIVAAIPIVLGAPPRSWGEKIEKKYFSEHFLNNYTVHQINDHVTGGLQDCYTHKPELLIDNYASFLAEFYGCIGEEEEKDKIITACENFPRMETIDDFIGIFEKKPDKPYYMPFVYDSHTAFTFLGGVSTLYWVFYSGSYKAFLEEFTTLKHFEKLLPKAITNPLANSVKVGIFG